MKKHIDKHKLYDALARHYLAFPNFAGDEAARIDDILIKKAATDAKIALINEAIDLENETLKAQEEAANLQALKPIWEKELVEEKAGLNRPEVIAELESNIASVPPVV